MMLALSSATWRLRRYPWILSFVGSVCAFIAIEIVSHHFSFQNLTINLGLAGFLTIAGLGQMFAITGGGGGIDLSVPQVLTLSAMASAAITDGHAGLTFAGSVAALGVGVVAGAANGGLVVLVRLPPIVATLASGFIMESLIQIFYPKAEAGAPSHGIEQFVHGHLLGLPAMLWVAVVATVIIAGVLQRSIFGRRLEAAGQNQRAAELVGISVLRIRFLSYVASGFMAAVTGLLRASGLSAGLQDVLEGLIIVLVISLRRGQ